MRLGNLNSTVVKSIEVITRVKTNLFPYIEYSSNSKVGTTTDA